MLPGITYDVILELAAANGIPHEVRRVTKAEVLGADELLLTPAPRRCLPSHARWQAGWQRKPGAMFARCIRCTRRSNAK